MNQPPMVPKHYGVYEGVVTKVDDPKKIHRVKLRVNEVTGALETAWARIAVPFGGPGVGIAFMVEPDTRVTVMFEAGDVNRPLVTGIIWNEKANKSQMPDASSGGDSVMKGSRGEDTAVGAYGVTLTEPDYGAAPQYPNNKVIRTKEHLLELDDTPGHERLSITFKKGSGYLDFNPDGSFVLRMAKKKYEVVGSDSAEHVTGKKDVVVGGNATFSARDIKIQGRNRDTMLSKETLEATSIKWTAAGTIEIQAAGPVTIKAPLVQLGLGAAPSPVHTVRTHPIDYITGIPIPGEPSVMGG